MNFPKPELDKEEAMHLWLSEHSSYAKEQLVLNYTGLVGYILKSMNLSVWDEDLYAIGLMGLVKAVNTYNPDKETAFITYAKLLAEQEIIRTFRKKRIIPAISLDESLDSEDSREIFYIDTIPDERNMEEEAIASVQLLEFFNNLTEKEKGIILLRTNGKTQREIAEMYELSRAHISRIISGIHKKYKKKYLAE